MHLVQHYAQSFKSIAFALMAVVALTVFSIEPVMAQTAALDASVGTEYLETNAATNMALVAVVLFTLAGLAMAIKWVKATFFG